MKCALMSLKHFKRVLLRFCARFTDCKKFGYNKLWRGGSKAFCACKLLRKTKKNRTNAHLCSIKRRNDEKASFFELFWCIVNAWLWSKCATETRLFNPPPHAHSVKADTDANRSGCCSHHGGVCGCSFGSVTCCDGSTSPSCGC